MIKKIWIDGFKSLRDFSIEFQPGLNILIGPNGAGKSNICHALGLVAAVVDNNMSEFMLSLGGTTAVFASWRRSDNKRITVTCEGQVDFEFEDSSKPENKKRHKISLEYVYSFQIVMQKSLKLVDESLRIRKKIHTGRYKTILRMERRPVNKLAVLQFDQKELAFVTLDFSNKKTKKVLDLPRDSTTSIFDLASTLALYCQLIRNDLRRHRAWNISPHVAKRPSDVLEPDTMMANGARLSNAVHFLANRRNKKLDDIDEFLKRILPDHKCLQPESMAQDQTRTFSTENNNGVKCLASALSDGTIKTIALMVALFRERSEFTIIEEPENYLHPLATKVLVEYLREEFEERTCVLTTHSESLLNSVRADEVIVVENVGGYSSATRPKEDVKLMKAIKDSGFGVGYHYISGALGGGPQ